MEEKRDEREFLTSRGNEEKISRNAFMLQV